MHHALALFLFLLAGCASSQLGFDAEPNGEFAGFVDAPQPGAPATEAWAEAPLVADLGQRDRALVVADPADAAPPSGPDDRAVPRQVIYTAHLSLVVVSIAEAQASVLATARELGGHLQKSDARSITVRVPAARFDEALTRMARLGEVIDRSVSAADVTEELFDLDIRIENARRARERLLEHLAKSEKIEDTLKIEAELTRLTEELERMEGRKRFLAAQVALSTIHVQFDSNSPQGQVDGPVIPFEWVARLGDGLVAGALESRPRAPRFLASGPDFDLPEGFLRYYQSSDLVEAMDADGVRIKVQRHSNFDAGGLAFWQKLARRALVEGRALAVTEERALGTSSERALLRGTREVAGERYGYVLVVLRTKKHVFTYEAWGPEERFGAVAASLEASAGSLRP